MKQSSVRSSRGVWVGIVSVAAILLAATGTVAALGSPEQGSAGKVQIQEAQVLPRAEAPAGSDLSVAESLQNAFNAAANKALPVVVEVDVTEVVQQNVSRSITPFDFFFGQTPGGQDVSSSGRALAPAWSSAGTGTPSTCSRTTTWSGMRQRSR